MSVYKKIRPKIEFFLYQCVSILKLFIYLQSETLKTYSYENTG